MPMRVCSRLAETEEDTVLIPIPGDLVAPRSLQFSNSIPRDFVAFVDEWLVGQVAAEVFLENFSAS